MDSSNQETAKVADKLPETEPRVENDESSVAENSVVSQEPNFENERPLVNCQATTNTVQPSNDCAILEKVLDKNTAASEVSLETNEVPHTSEVISPTASTGSSPTRCTPKSEYHVKWIQWKQKKTPIITQNENGPCPLIAIINVLILKARISIPPMVEIVTVNQLMEYLGDCMVDSIPKNIPVGAQLNYEQNMHDAMAILPKLQTGLDVNVKFTGVSDFEYTPECIVFDLLHIPLCHGWLVDPQTLEVQAAVGNCSYNQLVERIINNKTSQRAEVVTEALIAESFLERTASQLTYHGLCELTSSLKEEELCVLFRNNHFITLYKHKNELFQLVTDQGFLTESNVVWETLNNIEGDGQFVDANFMTVPPKASGLVAAPPQDLSLEQQIDQDLLLALSLQEEQQSQQQQEIDWEEFKTKSLGVTNTMTDEELARRLQEEEARYAAGSAASGSPSQQSQQPHSVQHSRSGSGVPSSTNGGSLTSGSQTGSLNGSRNGRSRNRNCPIL